MALTKEQQIAKHERAIAKLKAEISPRGVAIKAIESSIAKGGWYVSQGYLYTDDQTIKAMMSHALPIGSDTDTPLIVSMTDFGYACVADFEIDVDNPEFVKNIMLGKSGAFSAGCLPLIRDIVGGECDCIADQICQLREDIKSLEQEAEKWYKLRNIVEVG